MSKPVIGIFTCRVFKENDSLQPLEMAAQCFSYSQAVEENGGLPLLIPYTESFETVSSLLELCDGLLVPGGIDVAPSFYGEAPDDHLGEVDTVLDKAELFGLQFALSNHMPVFGICRGLQIINVFCGGTLYQDLPSQFQGRLLTHSQTLSRSEVAHPVNIQKDSMLRLLLGRDIVSVNSMHHQAVKEPGHFLSVSARAEDGVIEAVEHENGNWFAVQWHPEELMYMPEMKRLFVRFISLSTEYQAKKFT